MASFPVISAGDLVELKKPHPCGSHIFKVLRVGADFKICCNQCERTLTLDRIKFEKMIKKILPNGDLKWTTLNKKQL